MSETKTRSGGYSLSYVQLKESKCPDSGEEQPEGVPEWFKLKTVFLSGTAQKSSLEVWGASVKVLVATFTAVTV